MIYGTPLQKPVQLSDWSEEDQWYGPNDVYFRIRTDDGNTVRAQPQRTK
jgi:hypothetical protein